MKMDCSRFTVRQLIEMDACTRCGICVDWCPTCVEANDVGISPLRKLAAFKRENSPVLKSFDKLLHRTPLSLPAYSEDTFQCTLCGRCQEVCPVDLGLKDIWLSLRHTLTSARLAPDAVSVLEKSLDSSRNIVNFDNQDRLQWVEGMNWAPADRFVKPKADIVYFVGCVASYYPMAFSVPRTLTAIMSAAGLSFSVMGGEEWCCGWPAIGAGIPETAESLIEHNIKAVETLGASAVVCSCPSCYHTWQTKYRASRELGFEVLHESQLLDKLIASGKLNLKPQESIVTYHDPCDLGRAARVYEEPRQVIKSIPGIQLVEMRNNRRVSLCCGGGGNLEAVDAQLADAVGGRKIAEIAETGTQHVVTACQQCKRSIATAARKRRLKLKVQDLSELVFDSIDFDPGEKTSS